MRVKAPLSLLSAGTAAMALTASFILLACGSSPVRDDLLRVKNIHLMGTFVIGPAVLTESTPALTAAEQRIADLSGVSGRGLQGELHINSEINGPIGNFRVTGSCTDCNQTTSLRVPLTAAKVMAGRELENQIRGDAESPFAALEATRSLPGYTAAQRAMSARLGSEKDFPTLSAAQEAFSLLMQTDEFQRLLQQNEDQAFVFVFVRLKPELQPASIETSGSERAYHQGMLQDRYEMTISASAGFQSFGATGLAVPDMRYAGNQETNLLHPPNQGCLPVILTLNSFNTAPVPMQQVAAPRFVSVNWFDIARNGARQNVFEASAGKATMSPHASGQLQRALTDMMQPMATDLVTRMNEYLANVRE